MPSSGSNDPAAPALARLARALLGQQGVVGPLAREDVPDQRLGVAVGVRDEIGGARLRPHAPRRPAEALQEQRARLAGDPLGEGEVGVQKIARRIRTTHDDHERRRRPTYSRNWNASRSERRGLIKGCRSRL